MVQITTSIAGVLGLLSVLLLVANVYAQTVCEIPPPTVPGVVNYKTNPCAPVITGPDVVSRTTAPQYFPYGASSGCCDTGGFAWTVTGTGVSIDPSTGVVTVGTNACGSFFVTATDGCGHLETRGGRVANSGHWGASQVTACSVSPTGTTIDNGWLGGEGPFVEGALEVKYYTRSYVSCIGGSCSGSVSSSCGMQAGVEDIFNSCWISGCGTGPGANRAMYYWPRVTKFVREWECGS
jgi:hypothetical protein